MASQRRIFITGATGSIGRRLVADRLDRGDELVLLSRRPDEARRRFAAVANPRVHVLEGDPTVPGRWQAALARCDAVVHLAGTPLAAARWNPEIRNSIRRSRIDGTFQVAFAVRTAARPPEVLISASGTDLLACDLGRPLEEPGEAGQGFLAEVATHWEREAMRASAASRVIALRMPPVLDGDGGLLAAVLPWWRRGIDPLPWRRGDAVPWIHWRDLLEAIDHAIESPSLAGAVHAVAPEPTTGAELRRAAGELLGRRIHPLPRWIGRLAGGEMIAEIRGSRAVVPAALARSGFEWIVSDLHRALAIELGRSPLPSRRGDAVPRLPRRPTSASIVDHPATVTAPSSALPAVRAVVVLTPAAIGDAQARASAAIARWRAMGIDTVLAANDGHESIESLERGLDFTGPAVLDLGASLRHGAERRLLRANALPAEVVREVEARLSGISSLVVTRRAAEPAQPGLATPPTVRLEVRGNAAAIESALTRLAEGLWRDGRIAVFRLAAERVAITAGGIDKAAGLQRVLRSLALPPTRALVFASGDEDLGMLALCRGFATGAATARMKAAASEGPLAGSWAAIEAAVDAVWSDGSGGEATRAVGVHSTVPGSEGPPA